jgi:Family of unknown function (DUF6421)
MSEELIGEVNRVRRTLGDRRHYSEPDFLRRLAQTLKNNRVLIRQPIVERFIEDTATCRSPLLLRHTKAHINEKRDRYVFSLFDAGYFPSLSLDMLAYRPLNVSEQIAASYPSNTVPVTIEHMSAGFTARVVVALFPENHIDRVQRADDLIFYFIDKFVERHRRTTRRMVESIMCPDSFPVLASATLPEIERASSNWVWLHEYHHRKGSLPLPEYLPLKSYKPLAGLEELRVDVSAMLVCLREAGVTGREAQLTFEFVLAERLLRYSVEGIPKPNYDAVSSQVLFNYLLAEGGIELTAGIICLTSRLPDVLAQFLGRIEQTEALIQTMEPKAVRARLLAFVNQYCEYDEQTRDYRHIAYFAEVKERLNV